MQGREVSVIERDGSIRCTDQYGRSWLRKFTHRHEVPATSGEPGLIDRIQCAERLDHIGSFESIMSWRNDDIEMRRRNARIENLHSEGMLATPPAQASRQQCRATTTTDGDIGPRWRDRLSMTVAHASNRAHLQMRREPVPRRRQLQIDYPRRQVKRSRERDRLTCVAGGAIVD